MKKFVLSLLCIGGVLALPSCRDCCDTSCDPCQDTCDSYDDYCDKEDYCDNDSGREVWGYENKQGSRRKIYKSEKRDAAPAPRRKVMYKAISPAVQEAEAAGKTCKFLDERFHKSNKQMYKKSLQQDAPKKSRSKPMKSMEMNEMDME